MIHGRLVGTRSEPYPMSRSQLSGVRGHKSTDRDQAPDNLVTTLSAPKVAFIFHLIAFETGLFLARLLVT